MTQVVTTQAQAAEVDKGIFVLRVKSKVYNFYNNELYWTLAKMDFILHGYTRIDNDLA